MADLLRDGAEWLADVFEASVSESITYKRGSSQAITWKATRGEPDFEVLDADTGQPIQWNGLSWTGKVASLGLTPAAGDVIVDASGAEWMVSAPDGRTPWKWDDPYQQRVTVYTKALRSGK